eukprot:471519-Lingulodinium_polyedra.AAC.1
MHSGVSQRWLRFFSVAQLTRARAFTARASQKRRAFGARARVTRAALGMAIAWPLNGHSIG